MIKGSNVILRTVREADLDPLFELMSDVRNWGEYVTVHQFSEPLKKKEFHETGFWSEDKSWLLICDLENNIRGILSFCKEPTYDNCIEVGYALYDQSSRNKGMGTEAVSLLVKFLFSTRNVNRIQLVILPANTASKRVAEKCGFKYEGVARGAMFHNGVNQDAEVYSILRNEVSLI